MAQPLTLAVVALSLLATLSSAGKETPGGQQLVANNVDTIVGHVLTLKDAVDASSKEQWEALQSLRFHMLSARTGLKQTLQEIEALKLQVAECIAAGPAAGREDTEDNDEEPEVVVDTTTPSPGCRWPAEEVGGRCLVMVTDELMTWEGAQEHCRSLDGTLAGKGNFTSLQNYLTDQFGVASQLRVRWSVWAGARQTLSGWQWASKECSSDPVDAGVWASDHPRSSASQDFSLGCMALDGFNNYQGVTVPCSALRRFVCDLS